VTPWSRVGEDLLELLEAVQLEGAVLSPTHRPARGAVRILKLTQKLPWHCHSYVNGGLTGPAFDNRASRITRFATNKKRQFGKLLKMNLAESRLDGSPFPKVGSDILTFTEILSETGIQSCAAHVRQCRTVIDWVRSTGLETLYLRSSIPIARFLGLTSPGKLRIDDLP